MFSFLDLTGATFSLSDSLNVPTSVPTSTPTSYPSYRPTSNPTGAPTEFTDYPTPSPSAVPTIQPSAKPTAIPTSKPTFSAATKLTDGKIRLYDTTSSLKFTFDLDLSGGEYQCKSFNAATQITSSSTVNLAVTSTGNHYASDFTVIFMTSDNQATSQYIGKPAAGIFSPSEIASYDSTCDQITSSCVKFTTTTTSKTPGFNLCVCSMPLDHLEFTAHRYLSLNGKLLCRHTVILFDDIC